MVPRRQVQRLPFASESTRGHRVSTTSRCGCCARTRPPPGRAALVIHDTGDRKDRTATPPAARSIAVRRTLWMPWCPAARAPPAGALPVRRRSLPATPAIPPPGRPGTRPCRRSPARPRGRRSAPRRSAAAAGPALGAGPQPYLQWRQRRADLPVVHPSSPASRDAGAGVAAGLRYPRRSSKPSARARASRRRSRPPSTTTRPQGDQPMTCSRWWRGCRMRCRPLRAPRIGTNAQPPRRQIHRVAPIGQRPWAEQNGRRRIFGGSTFTAAGGLPGLPPALIGATSRVVAAGTSWGGFRRSWRVLSWWAWISPAGVGSAVPWWPTDCRPWQSAR